VTPRKPRGSAADQALPDKLAAMFDEDIDTSDIPELPGKNWAFAKRPMLHRPVMKPVMLRLDVDLVEWLEATRPSSAIRPKSTGRCGGILLGRGGK
jgi:uncharacterized protein (DUF4415 family)